MTRQNQVAEVKPDKKPRPRDEALPLTRQVRDVIGLTATPADPISAMGDGSVESQTAQLADSRFQGVQRRALVARIGVTQGNHHLQRVATSLLHHSRSAPLQSNHSQADTAPRTSTANGEMSEPGLEAQPAPVQRGLLDMVANPRQAALAKIADLAQEIPGYHLLTLILGRDPVTSRPVERTAKNVLHAALGLVPGGNALFQNLDQSGTLDKAFAWLTAQFSQLGLDWTTIRGLFSRAWDAVSLSSLAHPLDTWEKLKGIFLEPVTRVKNFLVSIGEKVLEFIFEGVMENLGGGQVLALLKRAGGAFLQIIQNPIGFLSNLIHGVKQGFLNFAANIGEHLKKGLMGWLFGELAATGIEIPAKFDLKGILSLVMQVLGLTWQNIRAHAVKTFGERTVSTLERGFGIFMILKEQGLGGLWEQIKEQLGNFKEMVLGGIKDMVIAQVIQAGIQWLISILGGPAGAVVKAVKMIYDVVMWFINNGSRLMGLINAIADSFGAIASGAVGIAAKFVEDALGKTVPIVISFLANLLGLGNLGGKIRGIIEKVQQPVQKAVGWVLSKAKGFATKVVGKVKGFASSVVGKFKKASGKEESEADQQKRLEKGLIVGKAAVERLPGNPISSGLIKPVLGLVRLRYRLGVLVPVQQNGYWAVHGELQRMADPKTNKKAPTDDGKVDIKGKLVRRQGMKWTPFVNRVLHDVQPEAYVEGTRKLKDGLHRRHIEAVDLAIREMENALQGQTYDKAAMMLAKVGVHVGTLTNDGIIEAAQLQIDQIDRKDPFILWVGPGAENSSLGAKRIEEDFPKDNKGKISISRKLRATFKKDFLDLYIPKRNG